MLLSTPGLVLHTTPYAESSVIAKVFTRQLGLRSYLIKGVRGNRGRVKQNLLQPLSSLDMVVYDNPKSELNYTKELSPRHPERSSEPVANALRFFMTEVLYKALREAEPMAPLFDYVEGIDTDSRPAELPVLFLLEVARHLGIEPWDNQSPREPFFDLEEGRYVSTESETTLSRRLSDLLHLYLCSPDTPSAPLADRSALVNALITYYHLHLSGFKNFHSHEVLHGILR